MYLNDKLACDVAILRFLQLLRELACDGMRARPQSAQLPRHLCLELLRLWERKEQGFGMIDLFLHEINGEMYRGNVARD